jgi:hypothetical protein
MLSLFIFTTLFASPAPAQCTDSASPACLEGAYEAVRLELPEGPSVRDGVPKIGGRRVRWDEFYGVALTRDHARHYQRRHNAKSLLSVFGIITMAGGGTALTASAAMYLTAGYATPATVAVPAGVFLVGLVQVIVAAGIQPHPLSDAELREVVDYRNAQHRTRLRLPRHAAAPSAGHSRSFAWAPFVSPSGGGLALSGRF